MADLEDDTVRNLRYTPFPDLFPCRSGQRFRDASHVTLNALGLPQELLLIAWAALLTRYTQDDQSIFRSDDTGFQVDAKKGSIQKISLSDIAGENRTGVYFNTKDAETRDDDALAIRYDSGRNLGELSSNGCVPAAHLEQLALQLRLAAEDASSAPLESPPARPTLSILNPKPQPVEGPKLLHHLVQWHVPKQDTAIEFMGANGMRSSLTWNQLGKMSDHLAAAIVSRLRPRAKSDLRSRVIPILLPQSPELYIAELAVLKAGCAFCPLHLDAPEERIDFILKDVSAELVLTNQSLRNKIDAHHGVFTVEVDLEHMSSADMPEVDVNPTDTAYMMYTSGSTGKPKGVAVSHLAVTQALLAHDRHIPFFKRFLQFASPTFDVSVFEVFFPWFRGSKLIGCERSRMLSDLCSVINSMEVDAAELTPTVAGSLLQTSQNVPGLKLLLTIGEMLTRRVVDEFGASPDRDGILYGMYGPTEAAIHCTLQTRFQADQKVGVIGVPLDTVSALILKPAGEGQVSDSDVLPVGQIGELAIGGTQLADGYINRPDQTAAAFFNTQHYGRLYRTGDKARMLPNGSLECLGRMATGQVKLRGQRVELGEIEEVLIQHKTCRAAVASIINGILVVFVLSEDPGESSDPLYRLCRRWLPSFMIPGDIVIIETLPRLASGKIDVKQLESQYRERTQDQDESSVEEGEHEAAVLTVARRVLGEHLSRKSDLVQNGMDSLRAIQITSQLRSSGYSTSATDILKCRSVLEVVGQVSPLEDALSRPLDDLLGNDLKKGLWLDALENSTVSENQFELLEVIPCTQLQNAFLFETLRNPRAYWNWIELKIDHETSAERVLNALQTIAEGNEILRSGFCQSDHAAHPFVQLIWKSLSTKQVSMVNEFDRSCPSDDLTLTLPLSIQVRSGADSSLVLVRIHHALYDGWSMDLIISDLNATLKGRSCYPRPSFRNVTAFQLHDANRSKQDFALTYWQETLADCYPCRLPDLNGQNITEGFLERLDHVSTVNLARLQSQSRHHKFNAQVYLQAAFGYLLSAYVGSSDVIFGTVSSGRTIPVTGIEDIIGPCISTLPLRVNVAQSRTVLDLLRVVHQLDRELLDHCTVPLQDIQNRCGSEPGRPLFDVLLVWQESLQSHVSQGSLVEVVDSADYLEHNLLLEFTPTDKELCVKATFQTSILPRAQVETLLVQLDSLVSWMLDSEDQLIEVASRCFRGQDLSIENSSYVQNPFDGGVVSKIQAQVRQRPNDVAISFASRCVNDGFSMINLTYGKLDTKARQVSRFLQSKGVQPGTLVGVCMDKSIELYASILAVMYTGAGYLPLTPDTPLERIRIIFQQSKLKICLSRGSEVHSLKDLAETETFDVDALEYSAFPRNTLSASSSPSDIAYAVFTSGSTGAPKGVLVTQQNLSSNIDNLATLYPTTTESKMLQACSQSFDVSVFEILFAWATGMCLCAATKDDLFQDIEGLINEFRITHLSLTPTVAALVNPGNVPSVNFLVTSGEAVTEQVFRAWADRGLWQGYGPSETTNICTVKPKVSASEKINNIGPPLPNTSAFVASSDSAFQLLPRGAVGELCFGGDQVFHGYLNMEELNKEKILDHQSYGRLYRSGDLGRLLPNGEILFEGRIDDQIKLRGQRIEPGEVNATVMDNNDVQDCITLLLQRESNDVQNLITFWVPRNFPENEFTIVSANNETTKRIVLIFESLKAALPVYMVPTNLVPISRLPMTSQGKIDKRQLRSVYEVLSVEELDSFADMQNPAQANQELTPKEKELASVLSNVLNVHQAEIGRHTSFFSLGLDSIGAISVERSVRRALDIEIDVSAVLKNPTIYRLAKILETEGHRNSLPASAGSGDNLRAFPGEVVENIKARFELRSRSEYKILPCTPLQEAMLSLSSDQRSYQNRTLFRVLGDVDQLIRCWREAYRRQDILRTRFVPTNDAQHAFAQVVFADLELPLITRTATTSENLADVAAEVEQTGTGVSKSENPFSLVNIRQGNCQYLLLAMHHALYDAVAIEQLLHEVERLYYQEDLPPPVPFEPFIDAIVSLDTAEADRFWADHLGQFKPHSFPHLRTVPETSKAGKSSYKTVKKALEVSFSELEAACRSISTTVLNMTQAAFAKILCSYLGTPDICFGNVVSGRSLPIDGIERLIAPCFNTLPVRVNLSSLSTNLELIRGLHRYNSDALPFQLTPLRRIQARNAAGGSKLFDTLFILQQPPKELDSSIWALEDDYGDMHFPFVIELIPNVLENVVSTVLHFEQSVLPPNDVQYIFSAFESALCSCMKYPAAPVTDLVQKDSTVEAGTPEFLILNPDESQVPVFGVGDVYVRSPEHNSSEAPLKRNGLEYYGTDRRGRLLPYNQYYGIQEPTRSEGEEADAQAGDTYTTRRDGSDTEWSPTEAVIRDTIARLASVSISQVRKSTKIYQLGLDSINAVQVAANLRSKGLNASASDVMEHPTCRDLAKELQQKQKPGPDSLKFDLDKFDTRYRRVICQKLGLDSRDIKKIRPCTPLQSGMIAETLRSGPGMYINYLEMRLDGVDFERLKQSWILVQKRYIMLRSGFVQINARSTPFAMVEYSEPASQLPWSEISDVCQKQETLEQNKGSIAKSMNQPPWRLLFVRSANTQTLILLAHHAIYDAQLLQSILGDVARAYGQMHFSPVQGLDDAVAEIVQSGEEDREEVHQFWSAQAKDMAITKFPSMSPLIEYNPTSFVEERTISISLASLENTCRDLGVTMQATVQAAWANILSSYVGEALVTFGVVLSGRTTDATENAPFPCITTVPISCNVDQKTHHLLKDMVDGNARVQRHQFTPLPKIQRWAGHPDEAIFDTILTFQKRGSSGDALSYPWRVEAEFATVTYAVSIELEPFVHTDELIVRVASRTNVLPEEQARLMLEQYEYCLLRLLSKTNHRCENPLELPARLFSIIPAKEPKIPSNVSCLHQFFEHTASAKPAATALEFTDTFDEYGTHSWTYRELNAAANRVAHLLQSYDIGPGDLVATCFDKCAEASVAFIGILKAGCAFVALDPAAPIARKVFIAQDCGAKLVLSVDNSSKELRDEGKIEVVSLDGRGLEQFPSSPVNLSRKVLPDDLCYCLYTSGTTGTPKGCMITHENAVQAMLSFQRLFAGHWNKKSRWLQFASFHFDVSVLEQFWSWSVGICVVSAPRDLLFQDFAEAIRRLDITHIDLTPSLARLLHPDDVPSLCRGVFITGGEQLKEEIIQTWGPKAVIYNGYGPTEATIGVTMYPRVPANGKPSNIGWQFDNVGTYVLKPGSEAAVLRGGSGELCVSGRLIGKGYIGRIDQTRERFPRLENHHEKVYRTGDLVRILHDNSFMFLGRIDDQVKLRGQRLEVAEINNVIREALPGASDVVTLVLKHPKQQREQLVTFLVIPSEADTKSQAQIAFNSGRSYQAIGVALETCHRKLPPYMVPSYICPVTAIPLTANNKVNTRELQELYVNMPISDLWSLSRREEAPEKPHAGTETQLAAAISHFLDVRFEDVTRKANIFALGVDSISAVALSSTLKQHGFPHSNISTIMQNPRIEQLAQALSSSSSLQKRESAAIAEQRVAAFREKYLADAIKALGLTGNDIEAIAPCTPLQQGMIARSQSRDGFAYFNRFVYDIPQDVDISRMRSAFEIAFQELQILRTRFVPTPEDFMQVVLQHQSLPWTDHEDPNEDSLHHYFENKFEEWRLNNHEYIKKPFELLHGRCEKTSRLAIHIFHALYDGNSLPLVLEIVSNVYFGDSEPKVGPSFHNILPYGPLSNPENAKSFWTNRLSGVHVGSLRPPQPPDSDMLPAASDQILGRKTIQLPTFDKICRELNVTDQAIFQACWTIILRQNFISSNGVVFGNVVSGRMIDYEGAERVVGPMFNTIPFACTLYPGDSWASLVRRCHDFNTAVLSYQQTPLRDILKWCQSSKDRPLFESLFVYQKDTSVTREISSLFGNLISSESHIDYPMSLEVERNVNGDFKLLLSGQGNVLDRQMSDRILGDIETTLHNILTDSSGLIESSIGQIQSQLDLQPEVEANSSDVAKKDIRDFTWTPKAYSIRHFIALQAAVDETQVDENTNILDLGLDSIDAIRLSHTLKKQGIPLSASVIMRNLTIPGMLLDIEPSSEGIPGPETIDVFAARARSLTDSVRRAGKLSDGTDLVLPVTPLQEGMLRGMLNTNFQNYFSHDVLKLSNSVNVEHLRRAWEEVFRSTDILQTCFVEIDGASAGQFVLHDRIFPWTETELDSHESFQSAMAGIEKEVRDHFECTPPVRIKIVYFRRERYLILSMAHSMYDGWTLALLHSKVRDLYAVLGEDDVSIPSENLPTKASRDTYENALRHILRSNSGESESFWLRHLHGYTSKMIAPENGNGDSEGDRIYREEIRSHIDVNTIKAFCRDESITMQTFGLTCWAFVLASVLRKLDVTFGVVLAGRNSQATDSAIFPTMNTVPIRTIVKGKVYDALRSLQKTMTDLIPYQYTPLRNIQAKILKNDKTTGATRIFDTLFIYQVRPPNADQDSEPIYESVDGSSAVEYPVSIEMEVVEGTLIWRAACQKRVGDSNYAKTLLKQMENVASTIVQNSALQVPLVNEKGTSICNLEPFPIKELDGTADHFAEDEMEGVELSGDVWSESEKKVRRVLSAFCRIPEEQILKKTTIFHLGLDSITSVQIPALLRKEGLAITMSDFMRVGSVEQIAAKAGHGTSPEQNVAQASLILDYILERLGPTELDSVSKLVGPDNVERVLPTSPGQDYFLSRYIHSRGAVFYAEFSYRILNWAEPFTTLQAAWNKLVQTSPVLRTHFVATNSDELPFVQVITKTAHIKLRRVSGERPVQTQPLVQPFWEPANKDSIVLKLRIHHALYDAVSLSNLQSRFQGLLNDARPKEELQSSYLHFLAQGLSQEAKSRQQTFWKNYLRSADGSFIPQPPAAPSYRTEFFERNFVSIQTAKNLASREGISIQAVFFSAWAQVYADLQAKPRSSRGRPSTVIFGIYLANRHHAPELATTFPAANVVPLRVRTVHRSEDLSGIAKQVHEDLQEIGTAENSSVRLSDIQQWTEDRVKIDCTVNYLSIPSSKDTTPERDGRVVVTDAGVGRPQNTSKVVKAQNEGFVVPQEVRLNERARKSYLHSIDVEVKEHDQGWLDIGIFAPTEMIGGKDGATKIMLDLKPWL
ncbi:MAG: NRPS [Bogoriella megaspora]|nr:MAG: NRPS [Bogoriella megaspora]